MGNTSKIKQLTEEIRLLTKELNKETRMGDTGAVIMHSNEIYAKTLEIDKLTM